MLGRGRKGVKEAGRRGGGGGERGGDARIAKGFLFSIPLKLSVNPIVGGKINRQKNSRKSQ